MVVVPKGTIERVLLTMHSQGTAAARHHRERLLSWVHCDTHEYVPTLWFALILTNVHL